jgi:hypothetical protein
VQSVVELVGVRRGEHRYIAHECAPRSFYALSCSRRLRFSIRGRGAVSTCIQISFVICRRIFLEYISDRSLYDPFSYF